MRLIRVLLVLFALLGASACRSNPPTPSTGVTPPPARTAAPSAPNRPAQTALPTQVVSPSDTEQVVGYKEQVQLVLPAGSVQQAAELTISPVTSQLPEIFPGMEQMPAYEISLGEQKTFDRPITLEFPIDPAKLNEGLPPTLQAQAAYWDEAGQQWVAAPATVDAARKVVAVQTTHLSVWSFVLWARGYETEPSAHFMFIYDKAELLKRTGSYSGQSGHSLPGMPPYITDLMDCLEKAYAAYDLEGYPLPATPIPVHVGPYDQAEYRTIVGRIRLPYDLTSLADMRQTTAHELFHTVQLKTLTTAVYSSMGWWLDATADYAADALAWKSIKGTGLMGQDIKKDWLSHDIYSTADSHAYGLSHFIDYLVRSVGINFKNLWYASVDSYPRILASVEAFVQSQSGYSLGYHFSNYLQDFIFSGVGPCRRCSSPFDPYADLTNHRTAWSTEHTQKGEATLSTSAPYYGASVWGIQIQDKDHDMVLERLDGGVGTVSVYILPEGDALGRSPVGPTWVQSGSPANVSLKKNDQLFVVMDNTVSVEPVPFSVRLSEVALPAVDVYRLMFQFSEGACGQQAASGFAWVLVRSEAGKFSPFYAQPSGGFVSTEHAITVDGSGKVEKVVGSDGKARTYMTLNLQGKDKMTSGSMSLSGTVRLLQNPENPTDWSTGDGSDPNGGSVDVDVNVAIPARPNDNYPGMACSVSAVSAYMYPK